MPASDTAPTIKVAVVGSANLDLVVHVQRTPAPGETVMGDHLTEHPGGKGLNQAVAAAKYAPTAFIGVLGSDHAGDVLRSALAEADVNTEFTRASPGESGVAVVNLDASGENSITVISGANLLVTAEQTVEALDLLRPTVVVTQLETPLESVVAAADWAKRNGARWVFNPSPLNQLAASSSDHAIHSLIQTADPLIVNEGEALEILHLSNSKLASDESIADQLAKQFTSIVMTGGSRGSYVGDRDTVMFVPAEKVDAVDTTGAGDAFAGTIAARLADGADLASASRDANLAAARVVATPRTER